MRAAALLFAVTGVTLAAQKAPDAFEVASVRENKSASSISSISGPRPGRFTIVNMPLRFIVLEAFGLLDHELIAAPEWTNAIALQEQLGLKLEPSKSPFEVVVIDSVQRPTPD